MFQLPLSSVFLSLPPSCLVTRRTGWLPVPAGFPSSLCHWLRGHSPPQGGPCSWLPRRPGPCDHLGLISSLPLSLMLTLSITLRGSSVQETTLFCPIFKPPDHASIIVSGEGAEDRMVVVKGGSNLTWNNHLTSSLERDEGACRPAPGLSSGLCLAHGEHKYKTHPHPGPRPDRLVPGASRDFQG